MTMKKSEALMHVAKVFADGYPKFGICNELMQLRKSGKISVRDYDMMVRYIRNLLGNFYYLEDWLAINCWEFNDSNCNSYRKFGPVHTQKMNNTRVQWCMHMATHWKQKGQ